MLEPKHISKTREKPRVFVAADHRLLHEVLTRLLSKPGCIEVIGSNPATTFDPDVLLELKPDILLLASRGILQQDLSTIQGVRAVAPAARILMMGMADDASEFLQCVRAGVCGYLLVDASSAEVLQPTPLGS